MDPIFDAIQQNLNSALSIPFVSSAVTLGLAFYSYKAGPELPSFVEELFLNVFFQIFVGFMVLYMTTGNFMLSLVVSVVFIYGMKMLSNVKEGMFGGNFEDDVKKANDQKKQTLEGLRLTKDNMIKYLTKNKMKVNDILNEIKTNYIDKPYNEYCNPLPPKTDTDKYSECIDTQKMSSYITKLMNKNFTDLSDIIDYIRNNPDTSIKNQQSIPYLIYTVLQIFIKNKVKNSHEYSIAYKKMNAYDDYALNLYFDDYMLRPAIISVYYKNVDRIF